jgi:hypothetical protein
MLLRHRGPRGGSYPSPDQRTGRHPNRSTDQADHGTRSGPGRGTARGTITGGLAASREAAKQQQQQRRMTHERPRPRDVSRFAGNIADFETQQARRDSDLTVCSTQPLDDHLTGQAQPRGRTGRVASPPGKDNPF